MEYTDDDLRFGPKVVQSLNYNTNEWRSIKLDENGEIVPAEPEYSLPMSEALKMMNHICKGVAVPGYRIFNFVAPQAKPSPKPIQTLLALALLFQVWSRIKRKNWMVAREIVVENPEIFARIQKAIERDYNFDVKHSHLVEATTMILQVMKIDIVPRP